MKITKLNSNNFNKIISAGEYSIVCFAFDFRDSISKKKIVEISKLLGLSFHYFIIDGNLDVNRDLINRYRISMYPTIMAFKKEFKYLEFNCSVEVGEISKRILEHELTAL